MSNRVLIADIGNTATEFAIFEDGKLTEFLGYFKLPAESEKARKSLEKCGEITDGMVFSVVPKNDKLVIKMIRKVFHKDVKVFDWKSYVLEKKNPAIKEAIGADLLADLKQAEKEYSGPCLIADCGTITKLLLLDEKGYFEGLSLIPGIETSMKLFGSNTALLPKMEAACEADKKLGLNTVESMYHGVYWSTVYYVKEVLNSVKNKKCKLVITGGNLRFIKNEFPEAIIDPELTLKGMYILYQEVVR